MKITTLLVAILLLSQTSYGQRSTLDVVYSPEVQPCYHDIWTVSFVYADWVGLISSVDTHSIRSPYNGPFKIQVVNAGNYVPIKSQYSPYIYVDYDCEALVVLSAYPNTNCQALYWYPIANVNCNYTQG